MKQIRRRSPQFLRKGFSLIEMLIAVAITSILITALTLFVARSFDISREQLEQVRITEDARIQMERVSDTLRNVRFVDCNGDGFTDGTDENWLRQAGPYDVTVYSNADGDATAELVRYYINGTDLHRVVTEPEADLPNQRCTFPSGNEIDIVVATSVRNLEEQPAVPLFQYFTGPDALTERIGIELRIDVSPMQFPPEVQLVTQVSPRSVQCTSSSCGALVCTDPGSQSSFYSINDDFAEQAFNACKNHCATNPVLTGNECCGWGVSFSSSDTYVASYCSCSTGSIPASAQPTETVLLGDYTDFVRECLDGTACNGSTGVPYCNAGCLVGAGECGCDCS